MQGYRPANLLAIRIRCAACGAVTSTPGLPEGAILPRTAVAVIPNGLPAVGSSRLARDAVLACQEAMTQDYAKTRPLPASQQPMLLSRSTIEATAAEYDRLTGGRLADHAAASPPALGTQHGAWPFAWAVERLRQRVDQPGWSWLHQDDDAMAAMYIAALRDLLQGWGQHPLLERLTAPLGSPDRFLRTLAGFALARLLFDAGNQVGFALAGDDVELRFATQADDELSLALLAPPALQWAQREERSPDALRLALCDAMAAAQGRVNRNRPGIIVLAASILQPDFDQMVVDAIHAAFRSVGRRHRGVAAVAIVIPKVLQTGQLDRLGFGHAFYPIVNPHFAGQNPIRLGSAA